MEYKQEEKEKPGREELKEDISESVADGIKKAKPKKPRKKAAKKPRKGKKSRYDDMTSKEMYDLVRQKRDVILAKRGIPAKIPRGKAALIAICKKMRLK